MLVYDHRLLEYYRPKGLPFWWKVLPIKNIHLPRADKRRFKKLKWLPKELHFAAGMYSREWYGLIFDSFILLLPIVISAILIYAFPTYKHVLIFFMVISSILVNVWSSNREQATTNRRLRIVISRTGIQLAGTGEFLWKYVEKLALKSHPFRKYLLLQLTDGTVVEHKLFAEYQLVRGASYKKWGNVIDALNIYWQVAERELSKAPLENDEEKGIKQSLIDKKSGRLKQKTSPKPPGRRSNKSPKYSKHLMVNHRVGGRLRR